MALWQKRNMVVITQPQMQCSFMKVVDFEEFGNTENVKHGVVGMICFGSYVLSSLQCFLTS